MTLGQHLAELALRDLIGKEAKLASTKQILRKCLPVLRNVIDQIALPEAGKMALPACYGRHIIFVSPRRGMIADMHEWPKPVEELVSDDPADRAHVWAAMSSFIYQENLDAAMAAMATRLGHDGIKKFENSMSGLDNTGGTLVFQGQYGQTGLTSRGALTIFAGISGSDAAGVIGALPVPVLMKPGPIADWHEVDWGKDGNHRRLH